MTVLRNKLKNRPLPKIPMASRKLGRQAELGSGVYSSIRSEGQPGTLEQTSKVAVAKQVSCQSDTSYMEPFSVSAMMNTADLDRPSELTDDIYLNPVTSHILVDKSNKNTDQKDYVNGHIANKCITRNSLKTTDDTEYRNGGSMEFYLENSIIEIENNEGVTFGHKTGQHVILKSPVIQTDSNGYVPMKTDPLKY